MHRIPGSIQPILGNGRMIGLESRYVVLKPRKVGLMNDLIVEQEVPAWEKKKKVGLLEV